jgi:hypothetical protein
MKKDKRIRAKPKPAVATKALKAGAQAKRSRSRAMASQRARTAAELLSMDRDSPEFKIELRRQARNLAEAPDHEEVMRFIESLYEDWE